MDTFNPNQMPPMSGQPSEKSMGPLIAVIVILALIVIGGLYFLKERASQPIYTPTPVGDTITDSLNQQNSSDELNSIEAGLNATDTNNFDQGATTVETQLQ